jgi:hypothetical protein
LNEKLANLIAKAHTNDAWLRDRPRCDRFETL